MRFKPTPRFHWSDTPRKRAALRRKQQRERDALPLFSDLIAEQQPTADQVMAQREEGWRQWEREHRAREAAAWRSARRRIEAHEPAMRAAILTYWNNHRWLPGTSQYLTDMLTSIDLGKLIPDPVAGFRFATREDAAIEIGAQRYSRKSPALPINA